MIVIVFLLVFAMLPAISVSAMQSATPETIQGSRSSRLDLAAMALDSTVLPPELQLFYELYVPGERVASMLLGNRIPESEVADTGILWFYESVYMSPEGSTRIRSYVQEYPDDLSAARGFDLLEDEERTSPGSKAEDVSAPDVGEQPAELTIGYSEVEDTADEVNSLDLTFRVERVLAGVSMQAIGLTDRDRELVTALATTLEERINLTRSGDPLVLIDPQLARSVVEFGESWAPLDEGYVSAREQFGPDMPESLEETYVSGYLKSYALGDPAEGGFLLPRTTVGLATFDTQDSALEMLNSAAGLQPPFGGIVADREMATITGADAVLSYAYENPYLSEAEVDSFRIITLSGSVIMTVDVQGNGSAQAARELAFDVASHQIACLESQVSCFVEATAQRR